LEWAPPGQGSDAAELVLRAPRRVRALPRWQLRLAATAGLTLAVNWTHTAFFEIGPQFGIGVEYFVDKNLLVGLSGKFGPQFYTYSASPTDFAFTTQVVVGYRM